MGRVEQVLAIHVECNRVRAERNLPALNLDAALTDVAQKSAERVAALGVLRHGGGEEILAAGDLPLSPQALIRLWLSDRAHAEWVLKPDATLAGWGLAQGKGGWFYAGAFNGSGSFIDTYGPGPVQVASKWWRLWELFRRR